LSLEKLGPLIVWILTFAIGAAIKLFAFEGKPIIFDLPPDATLWTVGVLFSLATSEQTYSGARLKTTVNKTEAGDGYQIAYGVTLSDQPGFTPKFMYFLLTGIAAWIITLLLSGYAAKQYMPTNIYSTNFVIALIASYIIAIISIVGGIRLLYKTVS
jgi:hypothetical protein